MARFSIPLTGIPETFSIAIAGKTYRLTLTYRDTDEGGWVLDIANDTDDPGAAILQGVPLVTGADLLAQYPDLAFGFALTVEHPGDLLEGEPSFRGLGAIKFIVETPDGG